MVKVWVIEHCWIVFYELDTLLYFLLWSSVKYTSQWSCIFVFKHCQTVNWFDGCCRYKTCKLLCFLLTGRRKEEPCQLPFPPQPHDFVLPQPSLSPHGTKWPAPLPCLWAAEWISSAAVLSTLWYPSGQPADNTIKDGQRLFGWGSLDPPQERVWLPVLQQRHRATLFHYSGKDVSSETFQQVCCGESRPFLSVLDALPSRCPEHEWSQPEPHGDQHVPYPLALDLTQTWAEKLRLCYRPWFNVQ